MYIKYNYFIRTVSNTDSKYCKYNNMLLFELIKSFSNKIHWIKSACIVEWQLLWLLCRTGMYANNSRRIYAKLGLFYVVVAKWVHTHTHTQKGNNNKFNLYWYIDGLLFKGEFIHFVLYWRSFLFYILPFCGYC